MDFPSSLKRSFKSRAKIAADDDTHKPILSDTVDSSSSSMAVGDRRDVIVNINGGDSEVGIMNNGGGGGGPPQIWREKSYHEFRRRKPAAATEEEEEGGDGGEGFGFRRDDPPSKLIGEFLDRQRAAGGETSLDLDFEMEELRDDLRRPESPFRVSFHTPTAASDSVADAGPEMRYGSGSSSQLGEEEGRFQNRLRSSNIVSPAMENGGGEVLKCSSFQIRQSMIMTKTKSRLIDPPDPVVKASGQLKSGLMSRVSEPLLSKPPDEEEDDPFRIEDIPEGLKKNNLNTLTVLQWVSLILIVASLICTLIWWKDRSLRGLPYWKWEVLVLVLICGRLVSGWGMRIAVFFIERNFILRKRVLYFVYGVRKPVQNCIWLGLVILAWHYLFDERVEQEVNSNFLKYVSKILVCFLIGTLVWLVKTLMVKVLASSFHVSTFFDRIQESVFNQYVIETLSGPPLIEIKFIKEEEERTMAEVQKLQNAGATMPPDLKANAFPSSRRSGRLIGGSGILFPAKPQKTFSDNDKLSRAPSEREQDKGIPIDHLHRMNPKNISAWNMKRLIRIVKHGVLSTLDEQILEATNGDESSTLIKSEFEAKVAARKIFQNVARRGSKFIFLDDLLRFMRYDEAYKTMTLIGGSPDRDKISKCVLKNWVVNAFRERRALALTLNDTKTAVDKLHHMVNVLVCIIIAIVCSLILGIATSKFLLFLSSQIVVVAFIFGNSCKTVFEAIIFVFVMHPFDVGDRCEIDGIQMVVEEMNILTTIFLRYDNQKIQYPNSTLATKPISNYYRSPDMGDSVDFHIHISTPPEKIAIIKQRITSFVESKKDHWYACPTLVVMDLEELNKIKMSVWLRHRMNHQDMGERWLRRAALIDEMVRIFNELDIEYRLHPIDINIRAMPPPTTTNSRGGVPSSWEAL